MTGLLVGGVVAGYLWRSYLPLALPFESPLVADASSREFGDSAAQEIAKAATGRAEKAESERDRLAARVKMLEDAQKQSEREIADLKIKGVLLSHEN